ncbi:MAG: glycoside hydrolase family 15 protein [Acidobacteria bacterium]|nr:glycoside hydrolase family 15 protein [Acidobacteriota bacterium]
MINTFKDFSYSIEASNAKTHILNHGAIGNGRVLALISPTSAIEWLCLPNFDSPSVFGRILDIEKGGTFRFLSGYQEIPGKSTYITNTNVLSTTFKDNNCIWEVIDFAPRIPQGLGVEAPIEIVRLIRPIKGQPRILVDFNPCPNYGRTPAKLIQTTNGIEVLAFLASDAPLSLITDVPIPYLLNKQEFILNKAYFFSFYYGYRREIPTLTSISHSLELTIEGWRVWAKTCALPIFASAEVLRSALCLKLHVNHDTGAIIAAATTSIPEALNTPRTWDYRYCWLRDAAFVVEALRRLSHLSEGESFITYLRNVTESKNLQPVYSIHGGETLPEEFLPNLDGFCGNGYVRIGNAAYTQKQNDLMGELILCLETLLNDPRIVYENPEELFPLIERLVEDAIMAAPTPDTGIWEFRSMLRHYTFSRAMCWVAIERGAILARRFTRNNLAERWEKIAASEKQIILERGYNSKLGFFTQVLDGEFPDAANLLLPTLGIIPATDPRFVKTVENYEKLLVENGLMLRYRNVDDFGSTTNAFTICSFWWVEALALMGELEKAIEIFQKLLTYANPLGLFSEDIDPNNGTLLGNFPQAYTHVGLINAAMTISQLLEVKTGKIRAWS